MRVSIKTIQPLEFTLIVTTNNGPATNVTWTRNSREIGGGVIVLESVRYSRYRHTLTATEEGLYNCTVRNSIPSAVATALNVLGMSLPS